MGKESVFDQKKHYECYHLTSKSVWESRITREGLTPYAFSAADFEVLRVHLNRINTSQSKGVFLWKHLDWDVIRSFAKGKKLAEGGEFVLLKCRVPSSVLLTVQANIALHHDLWLNDRKIRGMNIPFDISMSHIPAEAIELVEVI